MPEYKLAAENRSEAGKGAARRLRASGRVPAVLYSPST
jgi:ribosomal protein L25 (general stress protein Ctc)